MEEGIGEVHVQAPIEHEGCEDRPGVFHCYALDGSETSEWAAYVRPAVALSLQDEDHLAYYAGAASVPLTWRPPVGRIWEMTVEGGDLLKGWKYSWEDDLLACKELLPTAKYVYMAACRSPQSATGLTKLLTLSRRCIREHIAALEQSCWVRSRRDGKRVLVLPTAPEPVQVKHGELLRKTVEISANRGESIMKVILDVTVVSTDYVENARPQFLLNPLTKKALEYDRLYWSGFAFEYNGAQHYRPTKKFPDKDVYLNTRAKDLMKMGMSTEQEITLVVVTKKDLTIEGMTRLIPEGLATWPLVDGPYLQAVREIAEQYIRSDTGEEG